MAVDRAFCNRPGKYHPVGFFKNQHPKMGGGRVGLKHRMTVGDDRQELKSDK